MLNLNPWPAKRQFFVLLFVALFAQPLMAQKNNDFTAYRNQVDSLFRAVDGLCKSDSGQRSAVNWLQRINALQAIREDADLRERYNNLDLHLEISSSLQRLADLDRAAKFSQALESASVSNTLELAILGKQALEEAYRFKSAGDAEKAVNYFSACLEGYKNCGKSQSSVDQIWKDQRLSWQWIRFYKAVSYRIMAQDEAAEKELNILIKTGWTEPQAYLELADVYQKQKKEDEMVKTYMAGLEKNPENIPLACKLTRYYVLTDQLKKAQALIKPFDPQLGENAELVLTKALVYEKKGDIKKAESLLKAAYKSDRYEVLINTEYAAFLLRKAGNSEAFDAESYAQQAYNMLYQATELSPSNTALQADLKTIKSKYPKVYVEKEEEN